MSLFTRFPCPKLHCLLRKSYLNEGRKRPPLFYRSHHLAGLSSAQLCSQRAIKARWSEMSEVWIVKVAPVPYGGRLREKLLIVSTTSTLSTPSWAEPTSLRFLLHLKQYFHWMKYSQVQQEPLELAATGIYGRQRWSAKCLWGDGWFSLSLHSQTERQQIAANIAGWS